MLMSLYNSSHMTSVDFNNCICFCSIKSEHMEFMHGINVELVVFLDNCLIRSTHASDSDTTKESLRFIEINQIDVKQKTLFSVGK